MAFIKKTSLEGTKVVLTAKKEGCNGYFEVGTVVKITATDPYRGYTFEDDEGNQVTEAGWNGFAPYTGD